MRETQARTSEPGPYVKLRALIEEIEAVHGPHIECNNKGCRDRRLSGMHCRDNDDCLEQAYEDCPLASLAQQLRGLLTPSPADPDPNTTTTVTTSQDRP